LPPELGGKKLVNTPGKYQKGIYLKVLTFSLYLLHVFFRLQSVTGWWQQKALWTITSRLRLGWCGGLGHKLYKRLSSPYQCYQQAQMSSLLLHNGAAILDCNCCYKALAARTKTSI